MAKMAGISRRNIFYLLAVRKKRPDLYEKVYNGSWSIYKAYTEMKKEENPPKTAEEIDENLTQHGAELMKELSSSAADKSAYDAEKPFYDPYNVAVGLRNKALDMSVSVMGDLPILKKAEDGAAKRRAQKQLFGLA